jgi:hypothetical protein
MSDRSGDDEFANRLPNCAFTHLPAHHAGCQRANALQHEQDNEQYNASHTITRELVLKLYCMLHGRRVGHGPLSVASTTHAAAATSSVASSIRRIMVGMASRMIFDD